MDGKRHMSWVLILMIVTIFSALSCEKAIIKSDPAITKTEDETLKKEQQAAEKAKQAEIDRKRDIKESTLTEQQRKAEEAKSAEAEKTGREVFINEDVYFEYDKYTLGPEAQALLQKKTKWLQSHPAVSVIIEGHCDERGTNEYNIALGERRAESVKTFLITLGIAASRMSTVSYGEERPIDTGNNEDAWSKNRRAHFVIK